MRKLVGALFACLVLIGLSGVALSGPMTLYSIGVRSATLYTIDQTNGSSISSVAITMAGFTVFHGNGLATNPLTNELYALLEVGFRDRRLAKIDPLTGVATHIGATGGFAWSGITFAADGTLYGVSGAGNPNPETLFTLDPNTGAPTLTVALGNGNDGEAIAYSPVDNLIYHSSGNTSTPIFETVNRTTFAITNITQSGDPHSEITAMAYAGAGAFFMADNALAGIVSTPQFFSVTSTGVYDLLGIMDHLTKGLALVESADVPAPAPGSLALVGLGLAGGALARRKKRR